MQYFQILRNVVSSHRRLRFFRLDCPLGKTCKGNSCHWEECQKQLPNQFKGVSWLSNSSTFYVKATYVHQ